LDAGFRLKAGLDASTDGTFIYDMKKFQPYQLKPQREDDNV